MANEKEIDDIIKMLDGKTQAGVSRINVRVAETDKEGQLGEVYHHGRCDVGSAWATGKVTNPDCRDIPDLPEE